MKALILLLIPIFSMANVLHPRVQLRQTDNKLNVVNIFAISTPTLISTSSVAITTSTNLLANKSGNQYAETKIVSFICTQDINVAFTTAGGPATGTAYYVPAKTEKLFLVDDTYPYMYGYSTVGGALCFVTEIQ